MESFDNANRKASFTNNPAGRSYRLDVIKAIAIIGVIFYHFGFLSNGYLGVDVFFVIGGFLMMQSYLKAAKNGGFNYLKSTIKRLIRFWPLVLFVGFCCLAIGFFTMLPDDFENLGESVVASDFFCENILSAITTKNYWNLSNNYKPLMHLWYLGVLVQAYIVLPFLFKFFDKIGKIFLKISVAVLFVISLVLYLLPIFSESAKFYYLPFRMFELLGGSLLCFFDLKKINSIALYIAQSVIFLITFFILCVNIVAIPKNIYLLVTVVLTIIYIYINKITDEINSKFVTYISFIGRASFSIYLIHQPVIAFTRYLFTAEIS